MSRDLTRWNRAGLSRFRYVDGNAVTHLERLRVALAAAYDPEGTGTPRWTELTERHRVQADETLADRHARLGAQYHDVRRDHAWEILRAFARSTHVLTEHVDAFANETFIGTATQWDSVRKLIAVLDARPKPDASARTQIAILAKAAGTLAKGFQIKNAPKDGGAPAIFETTEDLAVDPALNGLRPPDAERSQEPFTYAADGTASFPLQDGETPPVVGELGVLVIDEDPGESGYAVRVTGVPGAQVDLQGQPPAGAQTVERWRVSLLVGAERVQTPRLAGNDVAILSTDHNLVAGRSRIAWFDESAWRTGRITAVGGDRVRIDAEPMPSANEKLYLLTQADSQVVNGSRRVVLPTSRRAGGKVWKSDLGEFTGKIEEEPSGKAGVPLYDYVETLPAAFYLPAGSEPVATVKQSGVSGLVLAGVVDDVAQDDWLASAAATPQAARILSVEHHDGDTAIATAPALADLSAPIHTAFARKLRPLDHDRNRTPLFDETARSDKVSHLFVGPEAAHDLMAPGRRVIVTDGTTAHQAVVKAVDFDAPTPTIDIAPPLPGSEQTEPKAVAPMERWRATIDANVVPADHGETQPLKILGSGDATRSGQTMELRASELSFVADPTMPTGVRAALELQVGEQTWQQVANLARSGPTDPHYEARITESGSVEIRFGDGRAGRRLPTGTNNVRVVWRKGVGEAGNLPAGELAKIVKPDPLVDEVLHLVAATGGSQMETVASMRENAAAGLLALDRAVSVADFAALAAQNASVWQATAYAPPSSGARGETVRVVVVPAGGVMDGLKAELEAFLAAHTVPGVAATVEAYTPLPLSLDVTVAVRSAEYDPDQVRAAVEAAIRATWDIKAARLGAPLFRAQVLHLIEQQPGVENVAATILPMTWLGVVPTPRIGVSHTGGVRVVRPAPGQMIHVTAASQIAVRTIEFRT